MVFEDVRKHHIRVENQIVLLPFFAELCEDSPTIFKELLIDFILFDEYLRNLL